MIRAGTSSGTSTHFDGKYQLAANVGDVLEISYVGYATQSVTVGTSNTYNVSMALDNTLEEVVVTAKGHYTDAINASMTDWGVNATDAAAYLASAAVDYDTATGAWREKIGMQYWLAMYNRGFEGWYVYRKFDAPTFNTAFISGLPVPKRYTYPTNEQSLNEANWSAASTAIGGDKQQTRVFWDVN